MQHDACLKDATDNVSYKKGEWLNFFKHLSYQFRTQTRVLGTFQMRKLIFLQFVSYRLLVPDVKKLAAWMNKDRDDVCCGGGIKDRFVAWAFVEYSKLGGELSKQAGFFSVFYLLPWPSARRHSSPRPPPYDQKYPPQARLGMASLRHASCPSSLGVVSFMSRPRM